MEERQGGRSPHPIRTVDIEIKLTERHDKFKGWIRKVAVRCASKLYAVEDLEQEALIQMWRCLIFYPRLSDDEFVAMFKACFGRRMASIMKQVRVKQKVASLVTDPDPGIASEPERGETWYRDRIREVIGLCDEPSIWDWVEKGLDPERSLNGMPASVLKRVKSMVADCSM